MLHLWETKVSGVGPDQERSASESKGPYSESGREERAQQPGQEMSEQGQHAAILRENPCRTSGSVFDTSMPPGNTGEGDGDELVRLEKEMEMEADRSARRRMQMQIPITLRRFVALRRRWKEEKKIFFFKKKKK